MTVTLRGAAGALLLTAIAGAAHPQSPLFHSNQNAHFLQGLAAAGYGAIGRDWMASAPDHYPVFSKLVELTYRYLPIESVYVYYVVLLGVYLTSLLAIGRRAAGIAPATAVDDGYTTAAILLLASAVNHVAVRGAHVDLARLTQDGLASYYVLGGYFQPMVFGVLAFASVACFLAGFRWRAVVLLGALVSIHFASVLIAMTILLAYMLIVWRDERSSIAVARLGAVGAVLMLPAIAWALVAFRPTSAETARTAQELLVYVRAPHHYVPAAWWDWTSTVKLAVVVAVTWLTRGTPLGVVLLVPLLVALALTALQVATGSLDLAILMPWRIFAFLVPLAWMVLLAVAVRCVANRLRDVRPAIWRLARVGSLAALAVVGATGLLIMSIHLRVGATGDAMAMMRFVAATKTPDDVYLIPVQLEKFRLHTGARALVDEKAVAIRDVDMIEWYRRIRLAQAVHAAGGADCEALARLRRDEGVTHTVLSEGGTVRRCDRLRRLYRDRTYGVYRIDDRVGGL